MTPDTPLEEIYDRFIEKVKEVNNSRFYIGFLKSKRLSHQIIFHERRRHTIEDKDFRKLLLTAIAFLDECHKKDQENKRIYL